jgi:hypothetical protein
MHTISRGSLSRQLCGAGALLLLAAGCGSSTHPVTHTTQANALTQTTTAAAPQSRGTRVDKRKSHASASPGAAAPSAHSGSPTPAGHTSAAGRTGWQRFVYLANTLCEQAAGGPRVPPPPASSARLPDYARAALGPTVGITQFLQRLSAQTGHRAAVARLLSDYGRLVALYRLAAFIRPGAANPRSISAAQQATVTAAKQLHLPRCAPVASVGY